MHVNSGYTIQMIPIYPHGNNSIMLTECCEVAITDRESGCPKCGREVVGDKETVTSDRSRLRWNSATRYWKK